jgi:hypothetical protein
MRTSRGMVAVLVLPLLGLSPFSVFAEEPKGFAEFAWGSTRDRVNAELLQPKCGGLTSPHGDPQPICTRYELEGVGNVMLGLTFVDETLQGYSITVPIAKMQHFASAVEEKFGKRGAGDSSASQWRWSSGTTAILVRRTPLGGVLLVQTKAALDKTGKESREKTDQIKKGF